MSGIDREKVAVLALAEREESNHYTADTLEALLTALAAAEAREAKLRAALQGQQKLHRRLQLLEGFWQRKLAREKSWSAHVWSIFARENPGTAAIVKTAVGKALDDIEMACDLDGKLMKKVRVELARAALTDKGDTDNEG